jgi:polyhydroxyalkanoate synthesis regulator phasin
VCLCTSGRYKVSKLRQVSDSGQPAGEEPTVEQEGQERQPAESTTRLAETLVARFAHQKDFDALSVKVDDLQRRLEVLENRLGED